MGGLAVARGLLRSGLNFVVFERDARDARRQGYQIGLQKLGTDALRKLGCEDVAAYADSQGALKSMCVAKTTTTGGVKEMLRFPVGDGGGVIDRRQLRSLLMDGLGDVIRYEKTVVGCHALQNQGQYTRVACTMSDGTIEEGDVLLVCDGAKSRIRRLLFPDIESRFWRDTRVGSFAFSVEESWLLERPALHGLLEMGKETLVRVLGPNACSWLVMRQNGFVTVSFNHNIDAEGEIPLHTGAKEGEEDQVRNSEEDAALAWLRFIHQKAQGNQAMEQLVKSLEPRHIILGGPSHIWTSDPKAVLDLGSANVKMPVVLLGDACHPMTTHRGLGANTAFADAADAVHVLTSAPGDDLFLRHLQRNIAKRGAKSVSDSWQSTKSMHIASPLGIKVRNAVIGGVGTVVSWMK